MSFDVDIEDWNTDGRGRGHHGGKAVLVSQAHPGERVRLRLDKTTRGTLQGRVGELLRRDPRRVRTPCPHTFVCTGCPWLELDPSAEAESKQSRAQELVDGIEGAAGAEVESLVRSPTIFGYRCYTKQSLAHRRGRTLAGSYVAGTHHVADNAGCPVLVPELAQLVEATTAAVDRAGLRLHRPGDPVRGRSPRPGLRYLVARHSRATGEDLLTLVTSTPAGSSQREAEQALATGLLRRRAGLAGVHLLFNPSAGNVLLEGELVLSVGAGHIEEELAGFRHPIGPTSFFQINPMTADLMVRRAVDLASSDGKADEPILEGFCGVGTLTLPLAARGRRVRAVERSREAVQLLRRSADSAGLGDRISAAAGDAREVLPRWLEEHRRDPAPVVVLDPPRKGLGRALAEALARSTARRIVLLSCDPERLAFDLPPLLEGGFHLRRVVPFDPFPRTAHLETVSLLERPS
ncbi:MAG: 23S rRNA (uracil(1939)-C(5))-methyltransferase RlmD [Holophagales bacterium]|nr:23S rRNA (uracil(1939)-C(5))-methyltransferase RlmD [Holophagales bacterium]